MKKKPIYLILSIALLLISMTLQGQNKYYVDVNVSNSNPAVNEQFRIEYILKYKGRSGSFNLSGIQAKRPDMSNFRIIDQGGGMNMNMNFGFGGQDDMTLYKYAFVLEPKKKGKFTIGGFEYLWKNNSFKSESVTINVTEKGKVKKPDKKESSTADISSGELFAQTTVNKKNVYKGEPVIATHKLYSKKKLAGLNVNELPSYDGFWSEDIDIGKMKVTRQHIEGELYNVVTIGKKVLFPQKTSKLTIGSIDLKTKIQIIKTRKARNRSERFWYGKQIRYKDKVTKNVRSPEVSITSKPLPAKGKPANFSGQVGDFNMSVELTKDSISLNQGANLKVTIKGSGNISLLEVPNVDFPPDFEVYNPEISTQSKVTSNGVSGTKTFDFLLIPRSKGKFRIPPIKFSYFDVGEEEYVTLKSQAFDISVNKGSEDKSSAGIRTYSKKDVQHLGSDILYIFEAPLSLNKKGNPFYNSWFFRLLILIPLISIGIFAWLYRKRQKLYANTELLKTLRATKLAQKRLKQARKLKNSDRENAFFEEINQALLGYLGDRFNIPMSDITRDNVESKLEDSHIKDEHINQSIRLLDECDYARFAPSTEKASQDDIYHKAVELISNIEKDMK